MLKRLAQILAIYQPLQNTSASFENRCSFSRAVYFRIKTYSGQSPWLVKTIDECIVGYAYATPHRNRQAYQWTQEVHYVHPDFQRRGVASELYQRLIQDLKALGYQKYLVHHSA